MTTDQAYSLSLVSRISEIKKSIDGIEDLK